MVLPGHLAGGYLVTRLIFALGHPAFSPAQTTALLIIGTLSGDLPDIDLIKIYFKYRKAPKGIAPESHRNYVTHVPLLWLVIGLAIVAAGWLAGRIAMPDALFIQYLGWMVFAGSWSHLIFDTIENGVMWLWPFSKKRFQLKAVTEPENPERPGTFAFYWHYVSKHYFRRVTFWFEIAVTLAGLYFLFF